MEIVRTSPLKDDILEGICKQTCILQVIIVNSRR